MNSYSIFLNMYCNILLKTLTVTSVEVRISLIEYICLAWHLFVVTLNTYLLTFIHKHTCRPLNTYTYKQTHTHTHTVMAAMTVKLEIAPPKNSHY